MIPCLSLLPSPSFLKLSASQAQPFLKMALSKRSPSFLQTVPGEIRNQIFQYCIEDAVKSPKAKRSKELSGGRCFQVSVMPRWSGPGCLRMDGIGPLPLLFVNWQIHHELSTLIYGMVDEVSIGGYILQYDGEDPTTRWKCAYSLIQRHLNLQLYTRNLTISLPYLRGDVVRGHCRSLGLKYPTERKVKSKAWAVIPELKEFLGTFKALEGLTIVIRVERREPPDFEELLPLYAIYGDRMTMVIREVHPSSETGFVWTDPWLDLWALAWYDWKRKVDLELTVT